MKIPRSIWRCVITAWLNSELSDGVSLLQEARLVYVFLCAIYYLFNLDVQGQCSSINNSGDEPEPFQKPAISTML